MRAAPSPLEGAHALVTGASRGIGRAIALEMARRGTRVTVVARPSDDLTSLAAQIEALAIPADLAEPSEVDGLIEAVDASVAHLRRISPVEVSRV